ncbi:hypothetical protein RDWZM_003098 [Blomia tropicalis]|uniref:C2H2-type domain-containing protein n=1 Tax=Blomia tropicalis TaxID=40697 RepID=A0A9Q0ME20_BLOTA|nr:hypothetical protein BLOT_000860 [Blomia tropicalis]KAJ6224553.1 hypothetical protein RDWZM_003098 [Blomia tropicalis]
MTDNFDSESIADVMEVKVKLYSCRKCGIRYDSMENMEQHHRDAHIESDSSIKVEMDEDATELYIVGREGLEEMGLSDNHQLVQLAQEGENGQLVFQVIEQGDQSTIEVVNPSASTIVDQSEEGDNAKPNQTPTKRGRKRKNTTSEITVPIPSSRPKRVVVPNIKSEFYYESIPANTSNATASTSSVVESSNNEADLGEEEHQEIVNDAETTYHLVQEGDVITAWQTLPDSVTEGGEEASSEKVSVSIGTSNNDENNDQNNNQDEGEVEGVVGYPEEYTPTSKLAKGRINPPKDDDSALRRFPCPFQGCNYVAKYRSNLWDHKKTHTGEKPYICSWPSCTMRFSQTHQLKLHLRSHTGERPYICTWPGCNSAFSQKPGLKSHMLTHTGEKPFTCDFPGCGWSFRLKGALTDHKRAIHENAKKHVCEWPGCNKRFLQHCHLKKHIMGHADIKPFSCDWPNCNYKAVTMAYVTNHRKTHTGEKNYECTYPNCNKRFVKSSHVNRHRQRCHPDLFTDFNEDGTELEMEHSGEEDEENIEEQQDQEQTFTIQEVVQTTGLRRSRRGKQVATTTSSTTTTTPVTTNTNQQFMYIKTNNQNGDEEDEEGGTTVYIQSDEVEDGMVGVGDGVAQLLNGSVVTSETGETFILSTNAESGEMQATPI